MRSLTSWWHAGWSAGEDPLYNYVGHRIQGALTSYIQIQNDPKNEKIEFSNTKACWRSYRHNLEHSLQHAMEHRTAERTDGRKIRLKGPLAWNANGSYPYDTKTCHSGVGKVNFVMTPVGGLGWVLAEDILDKKVAERVEERTENRLLINTMRSALNQMRGGANILHGNRPWYRARGGERITLLHDRKTVMPTNEVPQAPASQPWKYVLRIYPPRANSPRSGLFGHLHRLRPASV